MELLNLPVTIVVKAPNQKIADHTVECGLNWTVRKLKEHLSNVYPSKPEENQQRIIYSGKLLKDELTLKEVLRQYEPNQTTHTIHLVCSPSTTDASYTYQPAASNATTTPESIQTTPTQTPSDGLRQRHIHSQEGGTNQNSENNFMPPFEHHSMPASSIYSQYPVGALHPGQYLQSMYVSPFGPAMMPSPMAVGHVMPGAFPYNTEQMAWMQQAYSHYMAQWMHHMQQSQPSFQPINQPTEVGVAATQPPNQNVVNNPPAVPIGRPEPVQQPIRMNAQGGPVMDDDEGEGGNRDWLDWMYMFVRFLMLALILHFYSSPHRFIATMVLVIVLFLYQGGWFHLNRGPVAAQRDQPANHNPDLQQHNGETIPDEAAGEEILEPVMPQEPNGLALAWSFIVGFFASLAPQPPPNVNAN